MSEMGQFRNTPKEQKISALPPTSDIARQRPRLTDDNHVRLNSLPSDAQQRLASGVMESMPSGETGIPRPDMSRTYEQLAGACIRTKPVVSLRSFRGALSLSASSLVHSIKPQPATGSTISSLRAQTKAST
jgi:hypothetical protein